MQKFGIYIIGDEILSGKRQSWFFVKLTIMQKSNVIQTLTQHKAKLSQQFGVSRLALFGSTARDEASDKSDVDILVSFDGVASSQRYFGVQFYLEDLLGCPVDLVTEKALRAELRPYIELEAIDVWYTNQRMAFLHYRYDYICRKCD